MHFFPFVILCIGIWLSVLTDGAQNEDNETIDERDSVFWTGKGEEELLKKIGTPLNKNKARNVILFLGDGMSIPTITATRMYKAQVEEKIGGEGEFLSFEKFPYTGLSRTYCVDYKVADSACSATAFLRGVKANKGTIGVNGRVAKGDCKASTDPSNRVEGIASWAQKAGKNTGFVTTSSVTDATPAGTYAFTANREWECDADLIKDGIDPAMCDDIAKQLILSEPGKNFNVIMGGGKRFFLPKIEKDEEENNGSRDDEVNLIHCWINEKSENQQNYAYVWNRTGLLDLRSPPDYLLGLFGTGGLDCHLNENHIQPTLQEMTIAAIKVLSKNPNGYFLLVEGGLIDTSHHENKAHLALDETLEFAKAVETAVNMTSEKDTLIIVTADHSHTMSISGYPTRPTNIFGISEEKAHDELPYAFLSYANGPSFHLENDKRYNLSNDETEDANYTFPSAVPLSLETHGGDDVVVFARGPRSHIFTGSYEESYLAIAMAYAGGFREGRPNRKT